MEEEIENPDYDLIDNKLANILSQDASLTSAVLGEIVGLSTSAVNERVRKLKNNGSIKKIAAFLSSEFMNMQVCAFIFINTNNFEREKKLSEMLKNHKNVMELHNITGEYSYLIKVRVPSIKSLDVFVSQILRSKDYITKISTQICMSSIKEESVIIDGAL